MKFKRRIAILSVFLLSALGILLVVQPAQAAQPVAINVCNANFAVTFEVVFPNRGGWYIPGPVRYCDVKTGIYPGEKFLVRVYKASNPNIHKDFVGGPYRIKSCTDIQSLWVGGTTYANTTVGYSC